MKTIIEEMGGSVCRRCINARYHVSLEPKDCSYALYKGICKTCGEMHHIVNSFSFFGKLKMLFAKRSEMK